MTPTAFEAHLLAWMPKIQQALWAQVDAGADPADLVGLISDDIEERDGCSDEVATLLSRQQAHEVIHAMRDEAAQSRRDLASFDALDDALQLRPGVFPVIVVQGERVHVLALKYQVLLHRGALA